MKYILSVILSLVSVAVFADDNLTLYYEANGQCSGLYATPPTSGCTGQSVGSVQLPSNYDSSFSGYFVDGVQIIDQNGDVNTNVSTLLAGKGKRGADQTAIPQFTNGGNDGTDYGPWNVYFYGGTNSGVPLRKFQYQRDPTWTVDNATYFGLFKNEAGIEHGVVHGWCPNSNPNTWNESACFTEPINCVSGCEGRIQVKLPYDASGDKSYWAWLDCDRGYHQDGYACVADNVTEETQVSQAECTATNGVWDGEYCRYLLHWNGGYCGEYKDNYYIAGRKNYVRCGSHTFWNLPYGGKLMGWCLDSSLNSACTDDTYGTVVIPANARGDIHLYPRVKCASGFTYNPNTINCDWVGPDFGTVDMTYTCSSSELWGCNTESKCTGKNGVWDANNHMCATSAFANSNGGSMWPTHDCNADRTCVGMERTPQEECADNGGEWGADNKCRYRVIFVQNVGIPYQELRPVCDTTYVPGETTQVTCDTTLGWGTFVGWCLDDQLKSACNSATPIADRKTVTLPANAKGNLVYYGKWICNDRAIMGTGACSAHVYEIGWVESHPGTIEYVCSSDDTSGCMNNTECTVAGGTWDNVAGMCYKFNTFGVADKNLTINFSCGAGGYRNKNYKVQYANKKVGDFILTPNAYEYCLPYPEAAKNFVGWSVSRGSNVGNAKLIWDADKWVPVPKTNSDTTVYYTVTAQWSRGGEHVCPDKYWKGVTSSGGLVDDAGRRQYPGIHLSTSGAMSQGGATVTGCPMYKCGDDQHYYGDWSSCTVKYQYYLWHRRFLGWCKNQSWTTGCSANPFAQYHHTSQFWDDGNHYYDRYECVDGWVLDSNHDCVCNKTRKPITFVTNGTIDSGTGRPKGLSSNCPTESCGDTPLASFEMQVMSNGKLVPGCRVMNIAGGDHVGWCVDAARTNCPDDLVFEGGKTYYAKFKCWANYHLDENGLCVKD